MVNRFEARIEVAPGGMLRTRETILVDFRGLSKHGIFRDIPVVYDCGDKLNRAYDLNVRSVQFLEAEYGMEMPSR